MIARFKRTGTNDSGAAFDVYDVDDGSFIHSVIVSVTGVISIVSGQDLDDDDKLAITCAVLEQEEKRGF